LKHHLSEIGQENLLPSELQFDLYLEFGVATQTLLSLIGLGLSRTSAIALNEFLASDSMSEAQVFDWLSSRRWENLDLPNIVKSETASLLSRRRTLRQ
jgi:hypothetical protein